MNNRPIYVPCLTLALIFLAAAAGKPAVRQTFVDQGRRLTVGANPSAIVAPDLNEDGLPEIVTADIGTMTDPREERPAHDQLSLLVAKGDLAYEPQPQLQTGFAPYAIVVANVDALKAPDLVVGSFLADRQRNFTLFRNLRNNLFEAIDFGIPRDTELPYKRQTDGDGASVFTTPGITSMIVADVNHDSYRDVVAAGWSSDLLVFLPGVPETYFGPPVFIPCEGGPRDIRAADFDADGEIDIAVTLYVEGKIELRKGDGKGGFALVARFDTRGRLPHKVRVADMNDDGKQDLVVSHCYTDDSIVIFYGDGDFKFSVSQEILLGEDREVLEQEIRDIVVTDLNGDSRPDIAAACFAAGKVSVFFNRSTGTDLPQAFHEEAYPFKDARPRALCEADFNQDGATDLGVALWDVNAVALLLRKANK